MPQYIFTTRVDPVSGPPSFADGLAKNGGPAGHCPRVHDAYSILTFSVITGRSPHNQYRGNTLRIQDVGDISKLASDQALIRASSARPCHRLSLRPDWLADARGHRKTAWEVCLPKHRLYAPAHDRA